MIKKNYSKTGKSCRVTFRHAPEEGIDRIQLLGEFNQWGSDSEDLMVKRKDGSYSITLSIPSGSEYRFRYLLDNQQWENDTQADNYRWNAYGSKDAILSLSEA